MDSSAYNVANIEKNCNALGGLFQQIITDMKSSSPIWEDFLGKATKLHAALRATSIATSAFLDAFQKVADLATNAKGATKELGSSLTRLCIRHRSIEKKLRDFTSAILEVMVLPLQEKKEEWKTRVLQLDKEHAKEQKKARSEIKRASSDTVRLQKKLKKGRSDIQGQLNTALQDITDKYLLLEEAEKNAVRQALIEQRSHFCQFLYNFKPVVDGEISMMSEMSHIQEIIDALCLLAGDPHTLPPSSEQVINDLKSSENQQTYNYQSPPSSPSSLGSRKSSMCSINSLNSNSSGSTQNYSPSHQPRHRSTLQPMVGGATIRLSSISSQDSGFTSQDALYLRPPSPSLLDFRRKSSAHDAGGTSAGAGTDSGGTTPSPSSAMSTWSNWPDPPYAVRQEPGSDRPHTISTAYERSHSRPALGADTFQPPETNPYAVPCVTGQGRAEGRAPNIPPPPLLGPKPRSKAVPTPTVPESARKKHTGPPVYVNTHELSTTSGSSEQNGASGRDDDDSNDDDDNTDFLELSAAMEHLNTCTAALEQSLTDGSTVNRLSSSSGYGTMTNTPTCSDDTLAPDVVKSNADDDTSDVKMTSAPAHVTSDSLAKFSTMPRIREREQGFTYQQPGAEKRPVSVTGLPVAPPTVRLSTSQTSASKAPLPPLRRNSSITGTIPVVPAHVPKLPGHDGKHVRSESSGKLAGTEPTPSDGEYVRFTICDSADSEVDDDDGDGDSVDDLPLPPPPDELCHDHYAETPCHGKGEGRVSSLIDKHSDIMEKLNETLASSTPPIYAVPQTITPPTSLACQPQPVYSTPHGDTTPIYAEPSTGLGSTPVDSSDDITPTGDPPPQECFLLQIKRGVCLRKTPTRDRSAPRL